MPTSLYATIDLEKARVGRTRVIPNEASDNIKTRWYESFRIYCAHMVANITFTVKSDNPIGGASVIGRAHLPVMEILNIGGGEMDRWLPICEKDGKPMESGAKVHVKLRYIDVARDPTSLWGRGVVGSYYSGVPSTFFPQHRGCMVSLYQDTHVLDGFLPKIPLAGGRYYEPRKCWEDIFDAIANARRFIYITGWSVNTKISLLRDPGRRPHPPVPTLGELLKRKASEGVRVLMLVWDDRTSVEVVKKDGLMATHNEETGDYFRGTGVHCVLCPRDPDGAGSRVQNLEISAMFTHHQKTLVVDDGGRILSFLGGIDLCDGRYDTQQHSLFRTLDTIAHRDDFHQPNFVGSTITKGGPREPWHDIHCRLQGSVARDVLFNFEQRWRKQGDGKELLLSSEELDLENNGNEDPSPEAWNVQIFRSIDGGAAADFPGTPEDAARCGLISGKNHIIDRSIQDAYINAIRRAKDFIYIENQYFIGSSYCWRAGDGVKVEDLGALHLIPKELSLKVVSKIEAGERFTVYIVIPMWPEGIPDSASVQAILDWQRRTMEMMYTDITQALDAKGLRGAVDPREYLSFYCLGNRETRKRGEYTPLEKPEPDTDYSRAQMARRFMIYVHAKMMIVDDEYIIIGSANINQRSMDGSRDTEIAMGAYQPSYLASVGQNAARGQIHGFRMALWYEHLGLLDDAFVRAGSVSCVRKVNGLAIRNWELYASGNGNPPTNDLPGHLLTYPVQVGNDGRIMELPNMKFFPDTKARILGNKSDYLPSILTE